MKGPFHGDRSAWKRWAFEAKRTLHSMGPDIAMCMTMVEKLFGIWGTRAVTAGDWKAD